MPWSRNRARNPMRSQSNSEIQRARAGLTGWEGAGRASAGRGGSPSRFKTGTDSDSLTRLLDEANHEVSSDGLPIRHAPHVRAALLAPELCAHPGVHMRPVHGRVGAAAGVGRHRGVTKRHDLNAKRVWGWQRRCVRPPHHLRALGGGGDHQRAGGGDFSRKRLEQEEGEGAGAGQAVAGVDVVGGEAELDAVRDLQSEGGIRRQCVRPGAKRSPASPGSRGCRFRNPRTLPSAARQSSLPAPQRWVLERKLPGVQSLYSTTHSKPRRGGPRADRVCTTTSTAAVPSKNASWEMWVCRLCSHSAQSWPSKVQDETGHTVSSASISVAAQGCCVGSEREGSGGCELAARPRGRALGQSSPRPRPRFQASGWRRLRDERRASRARDGACESVSRSP